MIASLVSLALAVSLLAAALWRLRAAGYSAGFAATVAALAAVQMASALSTVLLPAMLLAASLFATTRCALAFARTHGVRPVIAMGASLATVQIASPVGAVTTAFLAPVLATLPGRSGSRARNIGLLFLLLFLPVAEAASLAYFSRGFHFSPYALMATSLDGLVPRQALLAAAEPRLAGLIDVLAVVVLAFPVWLVALQNRALDVVACVTAALIAAIAVAALFRRSYPLAAFSPALAGLSLLIISNRSDKRNDRRALAAMAVSAGLSWLFAIV